MVKDPLRLAWHFRGLARPSSPADAKASPACIPSLKSCFPAIQLDLLLHEKLESTIMSLGASSHSVLVAFSYVVAKVFNLPDTSRMSILAPGGACLELRRLELLTSSLQSWRSTS